MVVARYYIYYIYIYIYIIYLRRKMHIIKNKWDYGMYCQKEQKPDKMSLLHSH